MKQAFIDVESNNRHLLKLSSQLAILLFSAARYFNRLRNYFWQMRVKVELEYILILKKLIYQNQFIQTENRAQNIASQLAQLIINDNLFRDRQIYIIVHSLGSVVLRRFIELLDQNMDHSKQFINDILIMGGIEDIDLLAKLRWNQVAVRIFNIYTQTYQELKNIQIYTEQKQSPCGLQSIPIMYKQIINHDLTYLIENHNNYSENLATIFRLIGFNNDYIPFLKDY